MLLQARYHPQQLGKPDSLKVSCYFRNTIFQKYPYKSQTCMGKRHDFLTIEANSGTENTKKLWQCNTRPFKEQIKKISMKCWISEGRKGPHTVLQGFSFSPRWQQGCWVHRSHTDFTFNSLSRIKKGFKVNAPILICSPEKTFLVNKWRFSLLNTVPNTIILSLHSIHCIYFKKTAQQHSGHNSKPQESSATANEIRCWNVHFSEADEGSDHFWKSATLY